MTPPFRRKGSRARVLVFIDLVQDIDILLPVLTAMRDDRDLEPRVVVSRWLSRESPRTEALLARRRLPFSWVRRLEVIAGRAPGLRGLSAVLGAAESSHPAHAAGHALARRAAADGLLAYTLQHGLENVGLSGPEASRRFASSAVFCWFPPDAIPPQTPIETLPKLRHVGRPAPSIQGRPESLASYEVGVFENLHAEQYAVNDRQRFLAGVEALAGAGVPTLVRPHPAGGWSEALSARARGWPRLTLRKAVDLRGETAGVAAAILQCRRVITTPSTVALDAARLNRPVGLAIRGGAVYTGLPVLEEPKDWLAFTVSAPDDLANNQAFLAAHLAPGDATPRILEQIKEDLSQKRLAETGRMW